MIESICKTFNGKAIKLKKDKNIVFYTSGHGFGHAVRQIEIIKEIFKYNIENNREHKVIVRTTAPEWVFNNSLGLFFKKLYPSRAPEIPLWFSYSRSLNDVGTVQADSLNMDIGATYEAARNFYSNFKERAVMEAEFIKSSRADFVVGDIPPLAFAAAKLAGVRSAGVTNFSWDFIYEEFAAENKGFNEIIDIVRSGYEKCGILLKLPFACPLPAFKNVSPVSMIARKPYISKEEVLKILNMAPAEFEGVTTVMISFGGFDTGGIRHENLSGYAGKLMFLTTIAPAAGEKYPSNVKFIDTSSGAISFENLFTVFDIIATKPGYGVVGDIIGADSTCLFTDRGRFREYEYLVDFLKKHTRSSIYISRNELLNCDFEPGIKELQSQIKKPEPIDTRGAYECAMAIIE